MRKRNIMIDMRRFMMLSGFMFSVGSVYFFLCDMFKIKRGVYE